MEKIAELQKIIDESDNIVFFGGAGVSTESGIPDFRSVNGIYSQKYLYPPEIIISHSFFFRSPEAFYRFYREKMMFPEAQPNDCHLGLAKLEKSGKLRAIITQNIDGLHQKAGSHKVIELHGSVWRNHCLQCGKEFGLEAILSSAGLPRCQCGGLIKPDVTLYEEELPDGAMEEAIRYVSQADVLIVGGTSLAVYPAASLVDFFKGRKLVSINQEPSRLDAQADLSIYGKIGEVFKKLR